MRDIAIVGGGPAGAMCGERLARAGYDVTIYDEHLAWEKPCGGGLTHKAIEAYPFLLSGPHPKKLIRTVELISSKGHRAQLALDHPIVIYSRTVLNGLLLERAEAAGCRVVRSRVNQIDTSGERARLTIGESARGSGFRGHRRGRAQFPAPGNASLVSQRPGNDARLFRARASRGNSREIPSPLRGLLVVVPALRPSFGRHLRQHGAAYQPGTSTALACDSWPTKKFPAKERDFYSHVLPSPQQQTLSARRVVGRNWALAGDAAAWVDPITGEGLYYALRSGDLLAEALIAGNPAEYPACIRKAFSTDLEFATRIARRFYRGRFLGGAVATRMIQFIERSPTFRALMADLFGGSQDYCGLKRRLWAQCGTTLTEVVGSLMKGQPALAKSVSVSHDS